MSKTGFAYHSDYLKHLTGDTHPERPERLQHLIRHLEQARILDQLVAIRPEAATGELVSMVHPEDHQEKIRRKCGPGLSVLDTDTVACVDSWEVALLAAGGALSACRSVISGEVDHAFCAVRPPGHHAEPTRAMGFCLLNNVAIAARFLQSRHGLKRVAILDWDVHHGNGTQAVFYDDASVFFCSIHQSPLYPGTGHEPETGGPGAEGTNLNIPLPPGSGDDDYCDVFEKRISPAVRDFAPEFLLLSAGFDAHHDDPLANMEVTAEGFGRLTALATRLAASCCDGRLVSLLEGGYDLSALAESVEAHLSGLLKSN